MKSWDIPALDGFPGPPRILSTTDETRAIVLGLAAGQTLAEHEVHERAWIVVISGDVQVTDSAGESVAARRGVVFELEPHERHSVLATNDARLLLLLAPWPGKGHPGKMTLDEKAHAQEHAADHAAALARDATTPGPNVPPTGSKTPSRARLAEIAADRWVTDGGSLLRASAEQHRHVERPAPGDARDSGTTPGAPAPASPT